MIKKTLCAIVIITILAAILLTGCATVGPAPARLSAEIGDRVAEMQGLHQHTIKAFFDSERKRVEDFLEKRWIPLYLQNYLATSRLMEVIETSTFIGESDRQTVATALGEYLDDPGEADQATDEIVAVISGLRRQESPGVREVLERYVEDDVLELAVNHVNSLLGAEDPGLIILEWAQDAQEEINFQRRELLQPLDEAERTVMSEVSAAYADILKANGVVTARLEAAAKLKESQDKLLSAFGVKDEADKLRSRLTHISGTVGEGIARASDVISNLDEGETAGLGAVSDALGVLREELLNLGTDDAPPEPDTSSVAP